MQVIDRARRNVPRILNYSVNESISPPHLSDILFIIRIGAPLSFEATASLAFSSYASCCWDVRHVSNNAHVRRGITPFQKCHLANKCCVVLHKWRDWEDKLDSGVG